MNMSHRYWVALGCLGGLWLTAPVRGEEVFLRFEDAPENGLVMAHVDLTPALQWCESGAATLGLIQAAADSGVTLQFIPDPDFDARERCRGLILARLPGRGTRLVRLQFGPDSHPPVSGVCTVDLAAVQIEHDPAKEGGLPSRLVFRDGERAIDSLHWQDRLHDPKLGGFRIADDKAAQVTRIADGPLGVAVRVASRFAGSKGAVPESKPSAVYQWVYLRDQPLVYVSVVQRQEQAFPWKEAHFLECHQSGDELPRWAGGKPLKLGEFTGADESQRFHDWAAMHDGRHAVAMLRSGAMQIYDGKGRYGPYLHAESGQAWTAWSGLEQHQSAWLWLGSAEDPLQAIARAAEQLPMQLDVTVTVGRLQQRMEQVHASAAKLRGEEQRQARRQLAIAGRLELAGRFGEAMAALEGRFPKTVQVLSAGDLSLMLETGAMGIRALGLLDCATGVELMAPVPAELFTLTLRREGSNEDVKVVASGKWGEAKAEALDEANWRLRWSGHGGVGLKALRVEAVARLDRAAGAIRWTLRAEPPPEWALREVVFPAVAVSRMNGAPEVVVPRGPGEVQRGLWQRAYRYSGRYPNGWTAMPWMAAGEPSRKTGLYVAVHDPQAATKEIELESHPSTHAVEFTYRHPPPDLNLPGRVFQMPGEAVWQILRGDWFDAARIYRDWASKHANWWPARGPDGRTDTPVWMRELPVWALTSGLPASVVPQVKKFSEALGVPIGVHWYNWHRIPFDNDYPHYFPTVDGFREAVAELQRGPVFIMPYINGRLWDSRDRGMEDWEFSKVARAGACKDEAGEPYLESYSSKEQDGSRVKLATMCPTTKIWQSKMSEVVGRLVNECGVKAVYLDQIAAAKPQLCFDRSHGHPLGGGDWWTEGYWSLLSKMRKTLPADRMLTTECNAEAYTHVMDGYLTWHWQADGQVPAFPAVYGGAIQMFGRAYRGGPTKDQAFRMKAGQQLVFGEQIGWLSPSVVNEPANLAFLRQVVQLRWRLKRFFYAGEMARPPKLGSANPRVTADWQWHGETPVTTDSVLTGAWSIPAEQRKALFCVNVSEQPLAVSWDAGAGEDAENLVVTAFSVDGNSLREQAVERVPRQFELAPRTAVAWELKGK